MVWKMQNACSALQGEQEPSLPSFGVSFLHGAQPAVSRHHCLIASIVWSVRASTFPSERKYVTHIQRLRMLNMPRWEGFLPD